MSGAKERPEARKHLEIWSEAWTFFPGLGSNGKKQTRALGYQACKLDFTSPSVSERKHTIRSGGGTTRVAEIDDGIKSLFQGGSSMSKRRWVRGAMASNPGILPATIIKCRFARLFRAGASIKVSPSAPGRINNTLENRGGDGAMVMGLKGCEDRIIKFHLEIKWQPA